MIQELCRKLGYQFSNPKMLETALTHRSYKELNNERLEFLGDAVVNMMIADLLYQQFPRAHEGELSRWRATLVNRDTLGDLGRSFELGRFLRLGAGELKSGGSERHSILSCAMEAVIGALYLDGGFEKCFERVRAWYMPLLNNLSHASSHKDPKTLLQEYLQSKQLELPVYIVNSITGEPHQQIFTVTCEVKDLKKSIQGAGSSRRRAEQDAAQNMLGIIKK